MLDGRSVHHHLGMTLKHFSASSPAADVAAAVRDDGAAIVDRLTYDATIIETGTTSYRLAHTRAGGANSSRHGGAKSS